MRVNHVLKVLTETSVKRIHVALSLNDLKQPIKLVDGQVLDDSLRHSSNLFLRRRSIKGLVDKVRVNLLKRRMSAINQVTQILNRWGLVLD